MLRVRKLNYNLLSWCIETYVIIFSGRSASLVNEIEGFGGIAVSDSNSVLDGEKIVQAAINAFGISDIAFHLKLLLSIS